MFVTATRLNKALAGKRLVRTDFRVPAFADTDLSGQTVLEAAARGKHLLIRTDAGLTLHTHLKMEGNWHLYGRGEKWRGPAHQARVVLETDDIVAVGFRLGVTEVLPTSREGEVVGHLGPDVLGSDWDQDEAVRRLASHPRRRIGDALIDQRVMAGPGNVYKCEVCFLRGLYPWTLVEGVPDLGGVVSLMKRVMEANRATGAQVTTGDPRKGRERWVYGRFGQPCRRCGTAVLRCRAQEPLGDRVTYWCPSCQPSTA